MHTNDVVERQNNKNKLSGAHWEPYIDFRDNSRRLQVIFDAHPKEIIGVTLHHTVFLTELDKYIDIVLHCEKGAGALDKSLVPLNVLGVFFPPCFHNVIIVWTQHISADFMFYVNNAKKSKGTINTIPENVRCLIWRSNKSYKRGRGSFLRVTTQF